MIKTGIMGGTFNPIHMGHLIMAEAARETCGLEKIIFMPSGNPYMKNAASILDGRLRAKMVELAIYDHPRFTLSMLEVEREGATYTCDTLKTLKEMHPEEEYYFILGADSLFSIETWYKPEMIFHDCVIVAACRGEESLLEIQKKAEELQDRYGAEIILLPERRIDLSSSEIRERLKAGRSVRYMIPEKVLKYIEDNSLYKDI